MSADALEGRKAWLANLFLSQLIDRINNVNGPSQMLGKAFDDSESYSARLDAWLRGDLAVLSKVADATAVNYPDAHREVNVERNKLWVARIRTMLADDHTEFVAIGIGHFVGPDNLLDQLRAAGLDVHRMN